MKLHVPATTTNFGAGFDTFGLALTLHNTFEFWESDTFSVEIEGEGRDLPKDERNLVIKVYKRACEIFGVKLKPFRLKQVNRIPTARGLGSSATAIVGSIEAFSKIHDLDLRLDEKLRIAFEFEPHPDNVLPAILGGFVVCVQNGTLTYNRLSFPEDISLVFAVPDFELSTEEARKVVKKDISLEEAVFNIQRASLFISAICTRRYDLLKEATEDRLHQVYRARLIRGFNRVKEAGRSAGAYCVFLSGAGPTLCALSSPDLSEKVGKAMKEAFEEEGLFARVLTLKACDRGAFWDEAVDP